MKKSLGDYIVDRTESLDDALIEQYFIEKEKTTIARLLDSEQYLLEGSRGIGKTMLMKTAAIRAAKDYNKDSVLAVWISFEESLRLERIQMQNINYYDPFLQWTMGKIMLETLKKIIDLKPQYLDALQGRLAKLFNAKTEDYSYKYYTKKLESYVELLERGDISNNVELETESPSNELSKVLDNPYGFKSFLLSLCEQFSIARIVFLFDEAAHVFSAQQQEKFFTFFKSLRDSKIACKAAVYPGLTHYGKSFERGQDAKELRVSWSPTNQEDINYITQILKTRIQEYSIEYWNKLTISPDIIRTICVCSNGNPRFAFHIIDEMDNMKAFEKITFQTLLNAIRMVFDNKWREFGTLESRMPRYKDYIEKAEIFTKNTIIPNLRQWNDKRRKNSRKLSLGFYIETEAYSKLSSLFDILAYANIINIDFSKKSIGQGFYGYYILINPSASFTDLIIREVSEIDNTSIAIENNQAYYMKTSIIQQLIESLIMDNEYHCPGNNCTFVTDDSGYVFCPKCGTKMIIEKEDESLYRILRSHSIDNLNIGIGTAARIKEKFNNIGELQDATIEDIKMKYIQEVRAEKVKNAVIEYMAG